MPVQYCISLYKFFYKSNRDFLAFWNFLIFFSVTVWPIFYNLDPEIQVLLFRYKSIFIIGRPRWGLAPKHRLEYGMSDMKMFERPKWYRAGPHGWVEKLYPCRWSWQLLAHKHLLTGQAARDAICSFHHINATRWTPFISSPAQLGKTPFRTCLLAFSLPSSPSNLDPNALLACKFLQSYSYTS